ncbi:MAG: hypothetical protein LBM60_01110 [Clostridium sp.]|jgi:hypothetical protein|nr:hypothetical protein [Clostridium sp.]
MKKAAKVILVLSAIAAVAVAVYYLMKKFDFFPAKDDEPDDEPEEADPSEDEVKISRNYVPLNTQMASDSSESDQSGFTPLTQQVTSDAKESVEEFFDDDEELTKEEMAAI